MFLNFIVRSDLCLCHLVSEVDLAEYTDNIGELGKNIWEVWQMNSSGAPWA